MLLLALLLPLLLVEAYAEDPGLDAVLPASQGQAAPVITTQEILAQIRSGEPLDYDNVTIIGPLYLAPGEGPVRQSIRITNSRFLGPIRIEAVTFAEVLDLRGGIFQDNVSFIKSRFLGDARFSGARFQRQADFAETYFGNWPPSSARIFKTIAALATLSLRVTQSSSIPASPAMSTLIMPSSCVPALSGMQTSKM